MALKHHVAFVVPLKPDAARPRPAVSDVPSPEHITARPPRPAASAQELALQFADEIIVDHFTNLGYKLVEVATGEWRFHRGKKSAAFWRFNIRAYATDLLVRASLQPDNSLWVSCDFEVWTFMSVIFEGDVATLAAEGNELESALRHAI